MLRQIERFHKSVNASTLFIVASGASESDSGLSMLGSGMVMSRHRSRVSGGMCELIWPKLPIAAA